MVSEEDEDQSLETRQKQSMAQCWQHNFTLINLPNTSDRHLLLQAKEAVILKLSANEMLAKCNVNVKHMGALGCTWSFISKGFQKPLANQG